MAFPCLIFLFSIIGFSRGAGIAGLEYLEPGPNFVRACCNLVSVSASELVYNAQTNTTNLVSVFADTPVQSLTLNTVRLTKDASPAMTATTIAFGADSKLEPNKMYLICLTTLTDQRAKCFVYRPCDCATCTSSRPWLMLNITNVQANDSTYIQLYTEPIFSIARPSLPVQFRFRVWDGWSYSSTCRGTYPTSAETAATCGVMEMHPEMSGTAAAYFDDALVWASGPNSTTNLTKSFPIRDNQILSTVTAAFDITLMISVLGPTYENVIIEVPTVTWNRNGWRVYSQPVPYPTPIQTNGYVSSTEDVESVTATCQSVQNRKAADPVGSTGAATAAVTTAASAPVIQANSTQRATVNATGQNSTQAPSANATGAANVTTTTRNPIVSILNNATNFNDTGISANTTRAPTTTAKAAPVATTVQATPAPTTKSAVRNSVQSKLIYGLFAIFLFG